ncbi:MAG: hypothetical protein HFH39_01590 [Lachnospiraceae bacterium]|nr:hypothetical protein [Lachnospiraceae bacterium]MCI9530505.1 hypothetical protein [Lachnospiraceae bacterium]
MKAAKYFRHAIAGLTAVAMAVTMLPTAGFGSVQAAVADSNMVMHWDMTMNDDGTVKDLTNNSHSGVIVDAVESTKVEGIDVLNLKGGYVEIPDGTISTDMDEVTVNMLVKVTQNVKSSWMWALGSSNKRYMYITGCSNQNSALRGGVGFVPASGGNGWDYESVIGGDKALDEGVWQNITATYSDATKDFTFYLNGEKQNSINMEAGNAKGTTLQGLMTAGDGKDGYMGWSFYEANDPKFKGSVADFRIYDKALSDAEVAELQDDIEEMLDSLSASDFTAKDIHLAEADCLGANASKDEIKADLALPSKTTIGEKNMEGNITKWVSSNPSVISEEGKVTIPLLDTSVTMTATVERNGITADKALVFTVIGNATDENLLQLDADSLIIPNADNIRGNINLPETGVNGSKVTWSSSNESVIKTTANGKILPGIVARQPQDTKVTLTAKLSKNDATLEKKFDCTVKKAVKIPETTDYIFAYFPYTSTKDERIYFGISEDGLNFDALNNGRFVLESRLGTHGLRDPFIIRSPEGDRFYLIATDLTVAGLEQDGTKYPGQGWDQNQKYGSQKIMVWESTDLVNWSDQRECKVARDNAGCTWAPEAYWDDETGQYVVFWASKTGDDGYGKQRVYYATTRDFYNFSEAEVWIEQSGSVIDTTVIKVGEYYYRYTKNEDGGTVNGTPSKRIFCQRSKSLTAPTADWELVHANSLDISGGQIEGGCIFKINTDDVANAKEVASLKGFQLEGDDVYCLVADRTGATIFPGLSSRIEDGNFHVLGTGKSETVGGKTLYSMPEPDASHGTIMPVTSEEYNNLRLKWDASYAAAAEGFVNKAEEAAAGLDLAATEVISDISLPSKTANGAAVTWESSNEAVITSTGKVTRPSPSAGDAVVELTATITVAGDGTVRDQIRRKSFRITVAKKDPAYYTVKFDSKGGSAINNATIVEGGKVSKPKDPTRSGYTFDGWYLGSTKYDFNAAVKSNITLTAHWKAAKFTVKFDSNGGSKVSSKTVQAGKTVSSPKTVRAKYTFVGWYKGSKKYNFKSKVTSNLTLKAKWKKVTVATAAVKSAKNNKSKKCEVIVKKVSGAKGYQLTYATDKKFKKNKKNVTVKATGKATLSKLKKGKKYYIKVRAYKTDSKGSKVYGKYSKVKTVTIRK